MSGLDVVVLANKDYVEEQYRRYRADPQLRRRALGALLRRLRAGADGTATAPRPTASRRPARATAAPATGAGRARRRRLRPGPLLPRARSPGRAPEPARAEARRPSAARAVGVRLRRRPTSIASSSARSFRGCAAATAARADRAPAGDLLPARSASSTCTSRTASSGCGSRSAWSRRSNQPELTRRRAACASSTSSSLAEGFEQFLQVRYPTAKRFSLEGGDALIPLLDTLVEEAGDARRRGDGASACRTAGA